MRDWAVALDMNLKEIRGYNDGVLRTLHVRFNIWQRKNNLRIYNCVSELTEIICFKEMNVTFLKPAKYQLKPKKRLGIIGISQNFYRAVDILKKAGIKHRS